MLPIVVVIVVSVVRGIRRSAEWGGCVSISIAFVFEFVIFVRVMMGSVGVMVGSIGVNLFFVGVALIFVGVKRDGGRGAG